MFLNLLRIRSQIPTTSTACFHSTPRPSRIRPHRIEPTRMAHGNSENIIKDFWGRKKDEGVTDWFWEAIQIRRQLAKYTVNRYSFERVAAFGPDLACLEWLMNCGATSVRMSDGTEITSQKQMKEFLKSYGFDRKKLTPLSPDLKPTPIDELNLLSRNPYYLARWSKAPPVFIDVIDATDSAIVDPGFQYLLELRQVKKMVLNFCDYFYNDAIRIMCAGRLRATLQEIEICFNGHINEIAFQQMTHLHSLRRAHFYMNPWVRSEQRIRAMFRESLPKIQITYPEMHTVGFGKNEVDLTRDEKRKY